MFTLWKYDKARCIYLFTQRMCRAISLYLFKKLATSKKQHNGGLIKPKTNIKSVAMNKYDFTYRFQIKN